MMRKHRVDIKASVIRRINENIERHDGTIIDVDDAKKSCTMRIGKNVYENVPLDKVYISEDAWDSIKRLGRKIKRAIIDAVIKIKGFLMPVDSEGNPLTEYINSPVNVASQDLGGNIMFCPSEHTLAEMSKNGIGTGNTYTMEQIVAHESAIQSRAGNKLWGRIMKVYNAHNDLTLEESVKIVNDKCYGHKNKQLTETIHSLKPNPAYGTPMDSESLQAELTYYIINHFTALKSKHKRDKTPLIWGVPGIGKTSIVNDVRKALAQQGYNLDFVYINSNGLQKEDFSLPDKMTNDFDQILIQQAAMSWLPCYNIEGLSEDQIRVLDNYYNTGAYKQQSGGVVDKINKELANLKDGEESEVKKYMKSKKKQKLGSENADSSAEDTADQTPKQCGGILFFDEMSRMDDVTNKICMGLIGDQKFQNLQLASGWMCICASNTHSDDNLDTGDIEFRRRFGEAMKDRFNQINFIPDLQSWLTWARDVNAETGEQNIDEMFCKFIETMKESAWYKTIDTLRDEMPDGTFSQELLDAIDGNDIVEIDNMKNDVEHNKLVYDMGMWSPRAWDVKISEAIKNDIMTLCQGDEELYMSCLKDDIRQKAVVSGNDILEVDYKVKNIDMNGVAEMLEKVPLALWRNWTTRSYKNITDGDMLRNTNRLAFFKAYIAYRIGFSSGHGQESPLKKMWDRYNEWESRFDYKAIQSLWDTHAFPTREWRNDDDIIYEGGMKKNYRGLEYSSWKFSPDTVNQVFSHVINTYGNDLANDIADDAKSILGIMKKNGGAVPDPNDTQFQKILSEMEYKYTNEFHKMIGSAVCPLIPNGVTPVVRNCVKIMFYSKVAKRFAHIATWLVKISFQTHAGLDGNSFKQMLTNIFNNALQQNQELCKSYAELQRVSRDFNFMEPMSMIMNNFQNPQI